MKKLLRRLLVVAGIVGGGAITARVLERRAIDRWSVGPPPPKRLIEGEERFVSTPDDARLRTMKIGEGPLIVLAHGIGGTLDHWAPIAQRLAARGFTVVTYDQRGHNQSTLGTAPFDPDQLGADLLTVIESVEQRPVVVAGHSMGGITIQGALDQGLAERVDALVLLATTHRPPTRLPGPPPRKLLDAFLAGCRHPVHGLALMRGGFGKHVHRDDLEALRQTWLALPPEHFAAATYGLADFDYTESLRSHRLPTRVVCGELDKVTPIDMSAQIAALCDAEVFDRLEGIGHMLIWEAEDVIVDHILASAARATD